MCPLDVFISNCIWVKFRILFVIALCSSQIYFISLVTYKFLAVAVFFSDCKNVLNFATGDKLILT